MRFTSILGHVLSLALATAQSCSYPGIESDLAHCRTGKAFCSTLLGRGPTTTTVSLTGVYTTTVPATTVPYSIVKSSTVHLTTTLPTLTIYETVCTTTSSAGAVGLHKVAVETAAAAAGGSCGVGHFSSAWVSNACECEYDSTTYIAKSTKTKKSGTTLGFNTNTRTTTTTAVYYSYSTTATTTIYHANCIPPAYADCNNPGTCYDYTLYECGLDPDAECACGLDANGIGTCFESASCDAYGTCVEDYDCASGEFCLYDSCCEGNVCAPYDVCVGDQTYPSSSPSGAAKVAKATGAVAKGGVLFNNGYKFGAM